MRELAVCIELDALNVEVCGANVRCATGCNLCWESRCYPDAGEEGDGENVEARLSVGGRVGEVPEQFLRPDGIGWEYFSGFWQGRTFGSIQSLFLGLG